MTASLLTGLLAGSLLLAAGCGGSAPGDTGARPVEPRPAESSTGVADQPVSPGPIEAGSPSPVTPKGNTVDPRPVPWKSATPVDDGRRLRLVWWSGVEPCTTLDRVEVTETGGEVKVTIYEGTAEDAQNVACIEIAVEKTTTVDLESPLAGRRVVDGAK